MVKKLKPIAPPKKLPVLWNGTNQVVMEKYVGKFTRDEIKAFAQEKSDLLKDVDFNGNIVVSLFFDSINDWRAGKRSSVGDPIVLHNHDSYDEEAPLDTIFPAFQIYYLKDAPRKGGCDGLRNDCLFNCIKDVLLDAMPWKYPASFKKYLEVERNEPVDIALIPKIENKLKSFKINVTGDHVVTSTKDCNRSINLKSISRKSTYCYRH